MARNGFKMNRQTGALEVYANGTLVMSLTSTGITVPVAMNFDGATVLPQAVTIGSVAYTFPADNGDNGEQLTTDGNGVLTWEAAAPN